MLLFLKNTDSYMKEIRMKEALIKYTEQLKINLTDEQLEQFEAYYNMVVEKNKVMNLTAITEEEEFALKHFADSLSVVAALNGPDYLSENKLNVIDIGTGAGFPGIPLKIAFPNLKVTLLDSLNKRVLFLQEVIDELGLTDIEAIHARAEEGARTDLRESFNLAVSRAVAAQSILSEYCLPYVKKGGIFVAYKSGDIEEELKASTRAIGILGGKLKDTVYITLPDSDISRSFVLTEKIKPTPGKYPRKPGTAKKEPL